MSTTCANLAVMRGYGRIIEAHLTNEGRSVAICGGAAAKPTERLAVKECQPRRRPVDPPYGAEKRSATASSSLCLHPVDRYGRITDPSLPSLHPLDTRSILRLEEVQCFHSDAFLLPGLMAPALMVHLPPMANVVFTKCHQPRSARPACPARSIASSSCVSPPYQTNLVPFPNTVGQAIAFVVCRQARDLPAPGQARARDSMSRIW